MDKYGYVVEIESHCTHSSRSGGSYGSWSESYINSLKYINRADNYPDIVSTVELNVGDTGYVVWAEWSSGDSFGRGECNRTEALAIFNEYAPAAELAQFALSVNDYAFNYTTSDGQFHQLYAPWCGYFESLNEIHVDFCTIGHKCSFKP